VDEETTRHKRGDGRVGSVVAKRLGVTPKELFRIMCVLRANARTKALMAEGVISGDKVSRVLYNLKDASKEDEMIDRVIGEGTNTTATERLVAEKNDPVSIIRHVQADVRKAMTLLSRYEKLLPGLNEKHKQAALEDLSRLNIVVVRLKGLCTD
jgi:uncharacterized protein YoaH (UPF0181 family)